MEMTDSADRKVVNTDGSSYLGNEFGSGGDGPMDPRIAKLEADVDNIKTNIGDMKVDNRASFGKIDTDIRDLRSTERTSFLWLLAALFGLAGLIAKGFDWI